MYRSLGLIFKKQRPEAGLTTLEWLLIVAAVAGLAALAVVLVQNVVDDTAEQISGSNARITAARVAATAIESEAKSATANDGRWNTWDKWEDYFGSQCRRLGITYSDANVTVAPTFSKPPTIMANASWFASPSAALSSALAGSNGTAGNNATATCGISS